MVTVRANQYDPGTGASHRVDGARVTFRGDRAPADSAIGDLILNYHVGSVALLSENDNLTGYGQPADLAGLQAGDCLLYTSRCV